MFLLVPAHPSSPGQKAVKQLLLLCSMFREIPEYSRLSRFVATLYKKASMMTSLATEQWLIDRLSKV